jgi:hypothetical protein
MKTIVLAILFSFSVGQRCVTGTVTVTFCLSGTKPDLAKIQHKME